MRSMMYLLFVRAHCIVELGLVHKEESVFLISAKQFFPSVSAHARFNDSKEIFLKVRETIRHPDHVDGNASLN